MKCLCVLTDRRAGTEHSLSLQTCDFDVDALLCRARTKQKTCQFSCTSSQKWLICHITILSTLQILAGALNAIWSSFILQFTGHLTHFLEHRPICQTREWTPLRKCRWAVQTQVIVVSSVSPPVPTETESLCCYEVHQGQLWSNSVSHTSTERAPIYDNRQMKAVLMNRKQHHNVPLVPMTGKGDWSSC